MKTKVEVTQEHIDAGERASCESCPVALALAETINDLWRVHGDKIYRYYEPRGIHLASGLRKGYDTPSIVTRKIKQYDDEGGMTPFSFVLDL